MKWRTPWIVMGLALASAGISQVKTPSERLCLDGVRVILYSVLGLLIDPDDAISRPVSVSVNSVGTAPLDAVSRPVTTLIAAPSTPSDAVSRVVTVAHDPWNTIDAVSRAVTVQPPGEITCRIIFSDLAEPASTAPLTATITLWDPVEGTPSVNYPVSLDTSGNFVISGLVGKWMMISVQEGTWLRKTSPVLATSGGTAGFELVLKNGDVDMDNEVGPGDFGALSSSFGSVDGDPNWEPNADLDRDGEVGPSDFGILSANFGEAGDEVP